MEERVATDRTPLLEGASIVTPHSTPSPSKPTTSDKAISGAKHALERVKIIADSESVKGVLASLGTQYSRLKENSERFPWIWAAIVVFASLSLVFIGVWESVKDLLCLRLVEVLIILNMILLAALCIVAEWTRYSPLFQVRSLVHIWARFLEKCLGRGLVQM